MDHSEQPTRRRWFELYPQDIAFALCGLLFIGLFGFVVLVSAGTRGGSELRSILLVEIALDVPVALALLWRRVYPRTTFVVIAAALTLSAVLAWLRVGNPLTPAVFAAPLALVAVVGHVPDKRWGWAALATAGFGALIAPHSLVMSASSRHPYGQFMWGNWIAMAILLFAVMASFYLWASRRRALRTARARELDELAQRNRLLQVEAQQHLALARTGERNRIAREVHDIVAHNLAVVQVQAATGVALGAADPAAAMESLRTIKQVSKDALAEVRYLVGVLREGESGGEWSPRAMVDQLPGLLDAVRASGLDVTTDGLDVAALRAAGQTWPATVQLACYRIIQESLTNVIKHGGPDARAFVSLDVDAGPGDGDVVEISVVNVGAGVGEADGGGSGYGLQGLRERASAVGGSFEAHPTTHGFEVHARLPLPPRRDR